MRRSRGFVWEWRYYITTAEGKRQLKQKTFSGKLYPTERSVRLAIEPDLEKINRAPVQPTHEYTFGEALNRYAKEELAQLNPTTQATNLSLIGVHLRPNFGDDLLKNITAVRVKSWLDGWQVSSHSKARARSVISRVFDLAMLWGWISTEKTSFS